MSRFHEEDSLFIRLFTADRFLECQLYFENWILKGWILDCPKAITIQCLWDLWNYVSTGCRSQIWKIFEFRIWKEPLLVQKQTIHQQKALDRSLNLAPWKWALHYQPRWILWLLGGFLAFLQFQGAILKLRWRAFCQCIICFITSIGFFQILNSKIFWIWILHPVHT